MMGKEMEEIRTFQTREIGTRSLRFQVVGLTQRELMDLSAQEQGRVFIFDGVEWIDDKMSVRFVPGNGIVEG